MKRNALRAIMSLGLVAIALFVTACSENKASDEALTGQTHERHATGMDTQVSDY